MCLLSFANDNKKINDINEKFTKKFSVIEKQMTDIQKTTNKDPPDVKNLEKKLEAFEKNIEEKCYTFEKKIIHLNKINNDKDLRISELENKLKEIQTRVSEITKNDEKVKEKKKKKCFGCDQCDFEAASEAGLRTHQAQIHSKISNQFPKICDLCEYEAKNKTEYKRHLKYHSYKEINFKCIECEFFCNTELQMEVHIGKKHTDKFDCGICDLEMNSPEDLKIHLTTCEQFKCDHCDKRFTTLSNIKTHLLEENKNIPLMEYLGIIHLKQNRIDNEIIDETLNQVKDLFPNFQSEVKIYNRDPN